jgi:hypothetical protein
MLSVSVCIRLPCSFHCYRLDSYERPKLCNNSCDLSFMTWVTISMELSRCLFDDISCLGHSGSDLCLYFPQSIIPTNHMIYERLRHVSIDRPKAHVEVGLVLDLGHAPFWYPAGSLFNVAMVGAIEKYDGVHRDQKLEPVRSDHRRHSLEAARGHMMDAGGRIARAGLINYTMLTDGLRGRLSLSSPSFLFNSVLLVPFRLQRSEEEPHSSAVRSVT